MLAAPSHDEHDESQSLHSTPSGYVLAVAHAVCINGRHSAPYCTCPIGHEQEVTPFVFDVTKPSAQVSQTDTVVHVAHYAAQLSQNPPISAVPSGQ